MGTFFRRQWRVIGLACVFVVAGHFLILQRTSDSGSRYLAIGGDTSHYINMILGEQEIVPAPFKFRVLVPWLASILPFSPTESLRVITYASFFLTYVVLLMACRRLGLNLWASAAGLIVAFAPAWHLVGYHNPFLVDGFGLAMISIMFFALVHDSFRGFLLAAIVGVLAREQVAIFACLWLLKDVRRGTIAIAAVALAILIPHIELAGVGAAAVSYHPSVTSIIKTHVGQMGSFVSEIYRAGELAWLVLPAGLVLVPLKKVSVLISIAAMSIGAAILTSFLATDVVRMCGILTPVMAVAGASLIHTLWSERQKAFVVVGLLLVASQALLSPAGSWLLAGIVSPEIATKARHVLWLLGMLYVAGVLYVLRHRLRWALKETVQEFVLMARSVRATAEGLFRSRRVA